MRSRDLSEARSRDLSEAKNPAMRGSLAAMIRAAELAREIAIQTNTAIVIVKDGKPVRVTAEELRKEREATAILPNQPLSSDVRMIQQSGRKVRS